MPTPEDFRKLALSFPGASEKEAWGHPTFRAPKMFAMLGEPHGANGGTLRMKSDLEAQRALVASDPEIFSVPPYVGGKGWIGVNLERVDPEELWELTADAWRAVAPKTAVKAWDEEHPV